MSVRRAACIPKGWRRGDAPHSLGRARRWRTAGTGAPAESPHRLGRARPGLHLGGAGARRRGARDPTVGISDQRERLRMEEAAGLGAGEAGRLGEAGGGGRAGGRGRARAEPTAHLGHGLRQGADRKLGPDDAHLPMVRTILEESSTGWPVSCASSAASPATRPRATWGVPRSSTSTGRRRKASPTGETGKKEGT